MRALRSHKRLKIAAARSKPRFDRVRRVKVRGKLRRPVAGIGGGARLEDV